MLLIRTTEFTVKTKYYFRNHNRDYYQRAIPLHLQRFFGGIKRIKKRLTGNHYTLIAEINKYAKEDDLLFAQLSKKDGDKSFFLEAQAKAILAKNEVRPGDGLIRSDSPEGFYDQPHLDLIEEYLRERKEKGEMTEADKLAERLLTKPMPITLSKALAFYFDHHKKTANLKFRKNTEKRYKNLYDIFGDVPIEQLEREQGRDYVLRRSRSVKSTSVDRELSTINAVLNFVIREAELNIANPFRSIPIAGLGEDSKDRLPFTNDEHKKLIGMCIDKQDEMRIILLLILITGMRVSEAIGLRVSDIKLEANVPHLILEEYDYRTLKTKHSIRLVPIISKVQPILKAYIAKLQTDILFPQYNNGKEILNTLASNSLNKYIRSEGVNDKTCHSARHSIRDLLREADIPDSIIDEIGGWSKQNIGAYYGKGYSLEKKFEALTKALEPVIS